MSLFSSPESSEDLIFSDSKTSEDFILGDSKTSHDIEEVSILRSSKKTYSRVEKSCNILNGSKKLLLGSSSNNLKNQESFLDNSINSKSTTNAKNIASSSPTSSKNDFNTNDVSKFIDGNNHTDSKRTLENKTIQEDPLLSLFGNEEDKRYAFDCDLEDEYISPIFQYRTKYQRTRKNLKRQIVGKKLDLDEPKSNHQSKNMLLKSVQTSIQTNSVSLSMSNKVILNGAKSNLQHSISPSEAESKTIGKYVINSEDLKANLPRNNTHFTHNSINGISLLDFVRKYSEERNQTCIKSGKSDSPKKPAKSKTSNAVKMTSNETSSLPKRPIQKVVPKSTEIKKGYNKRNNCHKDKSAVVEKLTTAHIQSNFQKSESAIIEKSIHMSTQNNLDSVNNGHYKKAIKKYDSNEVIKAISSEQTAFNSDIEEHKNAKRMKLNNGNFKQIKRPDTVDINTYSIQKTLQKSCDNLNSESSIQNSFPPPQFFTRTFEIIKDLNEDSSECGQVIETEATISSDLVVKIEDFLNNINSINFFPHIVDYEENFNNSSLEHISVEDFCDSRKVYNTLSMFCGKGYFPLLRNESEEIELGLENYQKTSVLNVLRDYVHNRIFKIFSLQELQFQTIQTDKILHYAYEELHEKECIYVTRFFCNSKLLTLESVVSKLSVIAVLMMFDKFKTIKKTQNQL